MTDRAQRPLISRQPSWTHLPSWTTWDSRLLARAAAFALGALALAWLVTSVTDEGGISWGERAGRALPLTPGCAAAGVWAALAPALARGEGRALESLGLPPGRVALAAVLGASAVTLAAAAATAAPAVDVRGFYPAATRASDWHYVVDGFVDRSRGIGVDAAGNARRQGPGTFSGHAVLPPQGRTAAALALATTGVALPLLAATSTLSRRRRLAKHIPSTKSPPVELLAAGAVIASSLFLFQAAAAHRSPALAAALPPGLLLAFAADRYHRYGSEK